MTVIGSSIAGRVWRFGGTVLALALVVNASVAFGEGSALTLRAVAGAGAAALPLTIELSRWSTDAERAPMLTALAPPPAPAAAPAAAPGAAGRGGSAAPGGRAAQAGRGGRGGRGGAPAASPIDRLTAAVKAAPTLGFVWSDGVTGHSIKYAWRTPGAGSPERIVLVTDRRLGAHTPGWVAASGPLAQADFTVLEIRLDAKGAGEGKSSLAANVAVDAAAQTLALDGYAAAPTLLKVSR